MRLWIKPRGVERFFHATRWQEETLLHHLGTAAPLWTYPSLRDRIPRGPTSPLTYRIKRENLLNECQCQVDSSVLEKIFSNIYIHTYLKTPVISVKLRNPVWEEINSISHLYKRAQGLENLQLLQSDGKQSANNFLHIVQKRWINRFR